MRSYVTNRFLRCKRNNSFSEWVTTSAGVQQESTLGPLLFSIFIYDIFLFLQMCDLANYADDSTMYASDKLVSRALYSKTTYLNLKGS